MLSVAGNWASGSKQMSYNIDKNVPMPRTYERGGLRAAIQGMAVGDSVALPLSDKRAPNLSANVRSAASALGLGEWKFKQQKNDVEMRVWRTA